MCFPRTYVEGVTQSPTLSTRFAYFSSNSRSSFHQHRQSTALARRYNRCVVRSHALRSGMEIARDFAHLPPPPGKKPTQLGFSVRRWADMSFCFPSFFLYFFLLYGFFVLVCGFLKWLRCCFNGGGNVLFVYEIEVL